jgi:hypothetical protein
VFIGSRLALLAEEGDSMSARDKAINYLSMIIGGALGVGVGVLIYNRTMARAKEIGLEEAEAALSAPNGDGTVDYDDVEAGLIDPETAAALMNDDDISLWENDDYDEGYRDDMPENHASDAKDANESGLAQGDSQHKDGLP